MSICLVVQPGFMVRLVSARHVCRTAIIVIGGVFLLQFYHAFTITAIIAEQQRLEAMRNVHELQPQIHPSLTHNVSVRDMLPVKQNVSKPAVSALQGSPCGGEMRRPSVELDRVDNWQRLGGKDVFVYSAFADRRAGGRGVVKILTVTSSKIQGSVYCHLWIPGQVKPSVVKAEAVAIRERMSYRYFAVWSLCQMTGSHDPEAVSLAFTQCGAPIAELPVHSLSGRSKEHTFMVCICGPVKFNYSDTSQFMEWVEINSLFGAEKFIAYNHSANAILLPHTQYYSSAGRLDWLPWDLPLTKADIKNFGHMALLNDCLYRTMFRTKYVAFLDLDEFIVPKKSYKSWLEVLQANHCEDKASANIRNVFYKLEWPDDEESAAKRDISKLQLKTLLKTKREKKVWPHMSRSKYIARPEMLSQAGVHGPHSFLNAKPPCNINEGEAWVQHYRWWDDPKPNWIVDKTLARFEDDIVRRVADTHSSVLASLHRRTL